MQKEDQWLNMLAAALVQRHPLSTLPTMNWDCRLADLMSSPTPPASLRGLNSLLGFQTPCEHAKAEVGLGAAYDLGLSDTNASAPPLGALGHLGLGAAYDLGLLGAQQIPPPPPIKRKIFVSYHHVGDQVYYDAFAKFFADKYEVFTDKSLERAYNSDDDDYVRFQIRDKDISGSSCTIVLCGARTHERKYVDWEIKATLDMKHGLIAIWLPTLPLAPNGGTEKPIRLQDNIDSKYAKWLRWGNTLTAEHLRATIEAAINTPTSLIRNWRALRHRNG